MWQRLLLAGASTLALLFSSMSANAEDTVNKSDKFCFPAQQSCANVTTQTCKIALSLRRGINLGNMLEAPNEGDWGIKYETRYADIISKKFSTVRLPVRWSNHASLDASATLDETFAKRVDQVIDELLDRGMFVIMDMHHYSQMYGKSPHFREKVVDESVVEERFYNMWRQIAERYKNKSDRLVFEILNEPQGDLTSDKWNRVLAKALSVIRKSNPERTVMFGPVSWYSVDKLDQLVIPDDNNIIIALHDYAPFEFTHQGITYLFTRDLKNVTCCDATQRKKIRYQVDKARLWNRYNGYPVHLGEFGAVNNADMQSRYNYTRYMRDTLESRGIGWTYWEFGSTFGAYDIKNNQWHEKIRSALLDD